LIRELAEVRDYEIDALKHVVLNPSSNHQPESGNPSHKTQNVNPKPSNLKIET
jgi:hypothetical protein